MENICNEQKPDEYYSNKDSESNQLSSQKAIKFFHEPSLESFSGLT